MNLATLLALLSLTLIDPTGDAIGDGALDPPTSPVYANVAVFDLQEVTLVVADDGAAVLRVSLGALGSAVTAAGGGAIAEDSATEGAGSDGEPGEDLRLEGAVQFDIGGMLAVVDVYLDTGEGGADRTLSGPNMLLPAGSGWHHAVRVSAEGAWGVTSAGDASDAPGSSPAAEALPGGEEGTAPDTEPQVLDYVPLPVVRSGNTLELSLPWTLDPEAAVDVYAMTGVHDPFSPSGWRQISPTASPWAFSGGDQLAPVIDLIAVDAAAQTAALRSGVLPRQDRAGELAALTSPWLWLMLAGLGLALAGLVLRGRVGRTGTAAAGESVEAASGDAGGAVDPEAERGVDEAFAADPDDDVDVVATLIPFDDEGDYDVDDEEGPVAPAPLPSEAATGGERPEAEGQPGAEPAGTPAAEPGDEALLDRGTPVPGLPPPPETKSSATFSTAVNESYLRMGDEVEDEAYLEAAPDDVESFWHPASRGRKTLVEVAHAPSGEPAHGADDREADEADTA